MKDLFKEDSEAYRLLNLMECFVGPNIVSSKEDKMPNAHRVETTGTKGSFVCQGLAKPRYRIYFNLQAYLVAEDISPLATTYDQPDGRRVIVTQVQ